MRIGLVVKQCCSAVLMVRYSKNEMRSVKSLVELGLKYFFLKICCINTLGHFLHSASGQRLHDSNCMNFLENNSHSDVCVGGRTGSLHLCVFKSILYCTSFRNVLPTVSCNLVKSCQKNGNCDLCGLILL